MAGSHLLALYNPGVDEYVQSPGKFQIWAAEHTLRDVQLCLILVWMPSHQVPSCAFQELVVRLVIKAFLSWGSAQASPDFTCLSVRDGQLSPLGQVPTGKVPPGSQVQILATVKLV